MTIGSLGVNIFFIMSGFLVSKSWDEHPRASAFIAKRLLRIMPGLAGVTVFCAFILGPLFTAIPLGAYFGDSHTYSYLQGVFLFSLQYVLPSVFWNNASDIVNGSIWTLPLEFLAYLGILAAAAAGLFKRRTGFVLLAALILATTSALIFLIKDPEKMVAGIKVLWLISTAPFS
jgi:peptidoglycan/LPS O-acetylase OafA/YrhL